eukprot:TRINITY_DN6543_c0_g2_i1.p3 TRINITY_DN6543_c0_g2~~TRINITY_DN6543_c0_g2_i1.p3  ORF type:complete len:104 (+),score=7.96 TRINITY_DN6543_c0_g2_i1:867-1178(+)
MAEAGEAEAPDAAQKDWGGYWIGPEDAAGSDDRSGKKSAIEAKYRYSRHENGGYSWAESAPCRPPRTPPGKSDSHSPVSHHLRPPPPWNEKPLQPAACAEPFS